MTILQNDKPMVDIYNESSINKDAYLYCIRLLTKRDYSHFKLSEKLKMKKFSEFEIEGVINILIEKNYLRENNYIEARVKGLINKNYSMALIQHKLKQEHITLSKTQISNFFRILDITEERQKELLTAKKLRLLNSDKFNEFQIRQKIDMYLKSKGHF